MRLPFEIESRMETVKAAVEQDGVELLDVQFRRNGARGFLTFIVDKKGGVTLEQCADINRRLGHFLDQESLESGDEGGILKGSYLLEVNSPGLDRPLKSIKDFGRVVGERVRVAWKSPDGAGLVALGDLKDVDDQGLTVQEDNGKETRILHEQVTKAARDIKI